jgi:hypothetical protein
MDASKLIELRRQAAEVYKSRANPSDSGLHTYNLRVKASAQSLQPPTSYIPNSDCCLTAAGLTSISPGVNSYPSSRLQTGSAGGRTITYDALTSRAAGLAVCCAPAGPPAEPLGIYYSTCYNDERLPSSLYNAPCTVPGYNQTPHFVSLTSTTSATLIFGTDKHIEPSA